MLNTQTMLISTQFSEVIKSQIKYHTTYTQQLKSQKREKKKKLSHDYSLEFMQNKGFKKTVLKMKVRETHHKKVKKKQRE